MEKKLQNEVSSLLDEASQFAQQGNREQAYQSSLKATTAAPNEPLAWYLRARNASSTEEQLMCLSRAYSLDPNYPDIKKELRSSVHTLLKQEPFLAYVYETEEFYQVRSGRELLVNVPKDRKYEVPYLKKKPGLAQPAFRWLSYSLIALFLGGVGAVLFAPIAAFQALRLQASAPSEAERVRLLIIFILSVVIWLAAIPISWLLLIRFYPS
jgi:tetratricopeptide (TPR) repeat protein